MLLTSSQLFKIIPQLEEADKFFSGKMSHDSLRTAQTNILFQIGLENRELMKAGQALMNKEMDLFKTDMLNLIDRFRSGKVGMTQTMKFFKELSGKRYTNMFRAGALSSGNPYYKELGLTKKDLAFINGARRYESKFFRKFLTDIRNPEHIPVHPYAQRAGYYAESGKCILNQNALVYTLDGWKKIKNIRVGDLVLTHKGRFRKVLAAIKHKEKAAINKKVSVSAKLPGIKELQTLAVTDDHRFYTPEGWIEAKYLKGKKVYFMGVGCEVCDSLLYLRGGYNLKFCLEHLRTNAHLALVGKIPYNKNKTYEEVYGIEKARALKEALSKNQLGVKFGTLEERFFGKELEKKHNNYSVSMKRTTAKLKREGYYASSMYLKDFAQRKASGFGFQNMSSEKVKAASRLGTQSVIKLYKNKTYEQRFGKKRAEEIKEKLSKLAILRIKNMSTKDTIPEKILESFLIQLNLEYEKQWVFKFGLADFYLPGYDIVLEADGDYWHNYPKGNKKDKIRDKYLTDSGYSVLRFWEHDLRENPKECKDRLIRFLGNHNGNFRLAEVKVVDVVYNKMINNTKYDLEIEEDNSFVCRGFVVHNSQFWNGAISGAGDNIRIFWMLGTPRTQSCPDCISLSSNRGGQGYTWKTLPTVPRSGLTQCIVSGKLGIYTNKGLKRVSKIIPNDLVLTHKGQFKKVNHILHSSYVGEVADIIVNVSGVKQKIIVTANHKFMDKEGIWQEAKGLKFGDSISVVMQKCPTCGKLFVLGDYLKECCSNKCSNKYHGKEQIMKAHERVGELILEGKFTHIGDFRKGKTYEEIYGTERAKLEKQKRGDGFSWLPNGWWKRSWEKKYGKEKALKMKNALSKRRMNKTYEEITDIKTAKKWRKVIGDYRRGKNFDELYGEHADAIRKKVGHPDPKKGLTWEEYYGIERATEMKSKCRERAIKRMKNNTTGFPWGKRTSIELKIEKILESLGLEFVTQKTVDDFCFVDFFLPKYNIVIECDGDYWHNYPFGTKRDKERDKYLSRKEYTVLRFWEHEINNSEKLVKDRIKRILFNHKRRYLLGIATIESIKIFKKKCIRYDLEVDEDHSYVSRSGLISKNCLFRCYCHLDIRQKAMPPHMQVPGKTTEGAMMAPGRYCSVYDSAGMKMEGTFPAEIESFVAEMNKARQMMAITKGRERMEWVMRRRAINKAIIERKGAYRVVPTISVQDLVSTIEAAAKKGGVLSELSSLLIADEIVFVRSDFSSVGIMRMENGRPTFISSNGIKLPLDDATDIAFLLKGQEIK